MNEFYIKRHFKLWEDNNKLLKRIVFLTIIISAALVVKVLVPFVDFSEKKLPVVNQISILESKITSNNEQLKAFEETNRILSEVKSTILRQPWQKDKQDLIQKYQQMSRSTSDTSGSREEYQKQADDTIRAIAEKLDEEILQPVLENSDGLSGTNNKTEKIIEEINELKQFISDWQHEYIGKNWYRTLSRKEMAMSDLTQSLNTQLNKFARTMTTEINALKNAKKEVNRKVKELNWQIDTEAEKLEELDDELQAILPSWLKGLININDVIQLLPFALLCAVMFVLMIGNNLTRSFNIYIKGENFDHKITEDPGMSSVWTFIHRGSFGTLQTLLAYTAFIIFCWVLFEKSIGLLTGWLLIDSSNAWIANLTFWEIFLWFGRGSFILLLGFVFIRFKQSRLPENELNIASNQ